MCGIAGTVAAQVGDAGRAVTAMCAAMIARGPDDGGVEAFPFGGLSLALGSRRLAIIDPSPAGHQPMIDADRGNAIVFNGMIYNFRELRAKLEGRGERFTSGCDTEVILRAYGVWGEACIERLEGMFAFAVLDPARGRLILARDRLGIKPLYYWHDGKSLAFASQVRALLASGLVPRRLSVNGIASYLASGAVEEPLTAIEDVSALPAAHVAVLEAGRLDLARRPLASRAYWSPPTLADLSPSRSDAETELLERLTVSVGSHLVSDRPTGVFLSGGIDSSTLAALAARHAPAVKTISVAFEESELSEGPYAAAVARAIGSEHTEITLTRSSFRRLLDEGFSAMDQPSFDALNTFVVSRSAASLGLKVALSGIGSDELFDGYQHVGRASVLERVARLPRPVVGVGARVVPVVVSGSRGAKLGEWLREGAVTAPYELMRRLFSPADVGRLLPGWRAGHARAAPPEAADPFNRLSIEVLSRYMRNVLLRDADAMGMANSLEIRVPFLHDPLVEWTLRLPGEVKGRSKSLLIASVRNLIPETVLKRRKQGFLLPITTWLGSDLGREVQETLSSSTAPSAALFDREALVDEWGRFQPGATGWLRPWALYALARWSETLPGSGG